MGRVLEGPLGAAGRKMRAKDEDEDKDEDKDTQPHAQNPDKAKTLRWAVLKGYPPWPCQILPYKKAREVIPRGPPAKTKAYKHCPVQYFGTGEYGWANPATLVPFEDMARKELEERCKKKKTYRLSIEQAYSMRDNGKNKPLGWWNGPPIPEKVPVKKEQKPEKPKKPAKERGAPGYPKRICSRPWPTDLCVPFPTKPFRLPEMLEIRSKPRFESIRRNIYMGRDEGSWPRPKRLPSPDILVCTCATGSGCRSDCINRKMHVRCCSKLCPCRKECTNKEFSQMKLPRLKAFLTPECGWGVRVKDAVAKGDFVVEYVGEIIDDAECERRMWEAKRANSHNFYMMELSSEKVIDARHKANISRLINSSCEPNCEAQKCVDAATGEVRVGIFAVRDIEAGEEVTYNYNFLHFGRTEEGDVTSFVCRCGAPSCKGRLDSASEMREKVASMIRRRIKIKKKVLKSRKKAGKKTGTKNGVAGKYTEAVIVDYKWSSKQFVVQYDDGKQENLKLETDENITFKFVKEPVQETPEHEQPLKKQKVEKH